MAWKKLADLPDGKVIGPGAIEFWAIREGKVWHQGRKIATADTASFEVFENRNFVARDARNIFHAWDRLARVDRESFRQIGMYWRDDASVYFEFETSLKPLQDSDPRSFRDLGGGYGADATSAWYCGRRMKRCLQSRNLHVVPENTLYARDGEQVYCDGKPLRGVRHAQWRMVHSEFSADDQSVYYLERKLPRVDIPSWQPLHGAWSKDRHHVFHMNLVEKNASPDGFDKAAAMGGQAQE